MLRGVNHQIIEVRDTDHPYFERALLFVRATYAAESIDKLEREGKAYVSAAETFSELRQARAMRWFKRCVLILSGGVVGMALGLVVTAFS